MNFTEEQQSKFAEAFAEALMKPSPLVRLLATYPVERLADGTWRFLPEPYASVQSGDGAPIGHSGTS